VIRTCLLNVVTVLAFFSVALSQSTYLGFDRNDYPGDANLKVLRQTFSYTGYWLNNPPGENANSWTGHRIAIQNAGFGFLVLFNGRLYAELKSVATKDSLATPSSFSIRSRADACSPSRKPTSTPGWTV
jgi:hypothetical protein